MQKANIVLLASYGHATHKEFEEVVAKDFGNLEDIFQ